jgi:hypothetical protein
VRAAETCRSECRAANIMLEGRLWGEGPLSISSERISQEISGGLCRGKQDSECLQAEEFPEGDQNSSSVEPIYTTDEHWTKSTFSTHCPTAHWNNSGKVISA